MVEKGEDLGRQEEEAIKKSAGFSRKVVEIKRVYLGEEVEDRYESIEEWLHLLIQGKRQIKEVKEVNLSLGGYSNHISLDQYMFLREHLGDSWEIYSQSVINALCSFLSFEELEEIKENFSELKHSEANPIDEQRLEDFIDGVKSLI